MPQIENSPPPVGHYKFVLRHNLWDTRSQAQHRTFYDEVCVSRAIDFQGEVQHTMFVREAGSRARLITKGWRDVTTAWMEHLEAQPFSGSGDAMELLGVLKSKSGPSAPGDLGLGWPNGRWRAARDELEKSGYMKRTGSGRSTRYEAAL